MPRCESYKLANDIQHDDSGEGFYESTVCAACGWRSEPTHTSWRDHFEGTDVESYLQGHGTGLSDRLHRKDTASSPATPPPPEPDSDARS